MNSGIEGNSYGAVINPTRISYKTGQGSSQVMRDAILIGTNDDEVNYGSTQTATDLILQIPMMYNNGVYVGAGALSLNMPDGTAKGGNARGMGAVDFQTLRISAPQVASGNYSIISGFNNTSSGSGTICMGVNNIASGGQSVAIGNGNTSSNFQTIALGYNNNSSGNQSVAIGNNNITSNTSSTAMGYNNTSSGNSSIAMGGSNAASIDYSVAMGNNNTASGQGGFALGGRNIASGLYSFAIGQYATTNNIRGKFVFGNNYNATVGLVQSGFINVYAGTIDATATILSSDGNTANYTNQCVLQNNNAIAFTIEVVARNTSTGMAGRWEAKGLIKRGANASTTALVGTPTVTLTNSDNEAWIVAGAISITADTTNGFLVVKATGAASTTIDWVAKILTTEVV
jgi:hypothetical protein